MSGKPRVGIFISGRGSNMAALIGAAVAPDFPAEIAVVVSNRADAGGLTMAQQARIPAVAIAGRRMAEFEAEADRILREHGVEIVCLAGFLRLLSADFLGRWKDRVLNIHPSLLPSFPGLEAQRQALRAGVKITGCTVHVVVPEMDAGPVVMQAAVPVLPDDDEFSLSARIIKREHEIYPAALARLARGEVTIKGNRAISHDAVRDDCLIVPRP